MSDVQDGSFSSVQARLNQIVDEVSAEDISLDDALKLYEEAVKLGLSACDLSEQDIEAYVAGETPDAREADAQPEEPQDSPAQPDAADAAAGEASADAEAAGSADAPAFPER